MSLIQEALKRQEMEAAGASNGKQGDGAGQAGQPDTPATEPPAQDGPAAMAEPPALPEPEGASSGVPVEAVIEKAEKGPKSRMWATVAGIIIVLLLAVGAAVYLLSLVVSRKPVASQPAVQEEAVDESVPVAVEPTESAPADLAEAPPAPKPVSEPVVQPQAAEPAKPVAVETAVKPSGQGAIASAPVVEAVPPPKIEKPVVKKEPEPVNLPPVQWPRLKLTAVLCGLGDDQDAARLNGIMVPEGGQIDGVTVKEVQQEGVLLQLEHETKFLRMGSSIY